MSKTHGPILFEEAKLIYSKGSHKKVLWNCPRCSKSFVKTFKLALKSKLCKPCNNIVRPKPNHSREKNPFFGKTHSVEFLERMKGESNPYWRGGFPRCEVCAIELSDRRGRFCPSHFQSGDRNPNWNPTYNRAKREQLRITPEYLAWAKAVKERDNFTCRDCGTKGGKLHSHHLKKWSKFPELRYDLSNGVTLCKTCHQKCHKIKLNR